MVVSWRWGEEKVSADVQQVLGLGQRGFLVGGWGQVVGGRRKRREARTANCGGAGFKDGETGEMRKKRGRCLLGPQQRGRWARWVQSFLDASPWPWKPFEKKGSSKAGERSAATGNCAGSREAGRCEEEAYLGDGDAVRVARSREDDDGAAVEGRENAFVWVEG